MGKDGKKGLGMGLGALFGEEYPRTEEKDVMVKVVVNLINKNNYE